MLDTKIIAFHLPQFHTIPENDEWWGKGFTEWVNIKRALPLFEGHNQPRTPYNKDYYNLLEEKTIRKQMDTAREYGVYGFCYYHYWFNGKLLLEKPLEKMRKMEDRLPYCFCWANEPWARTWDGRNKDILMPQVYGEEKEWEEHFTYLLTFFKDSSYIKKDGKPVFIIYRTKSIPRCEEMVRFFDECCKKNGFPGIYLIEEKVSASDKFYCTNADALLEFEPMYTRNYTRTLLERIIDRIQRFSPLGKTKGIRFFYFDNVWKRIVSRKHTLDEGKELFRGGFVDWDNTPRKGRNGIVAIGGSPEKFEHYLKIQIENSRKENSEYIFINAWNEWAEGAYLEPDEKNGYGYLEAIQRLVKES